MKEPGIAFEGLIQNAGVEYGISKILQFAGIGEVKNEKIPIRLQGVIGVIDDLFS